VNITRFDQALALALVTNAAILTTI